MLLSLLSVFLPLAPAFEKSGFWEPFTLKVYTEWNSPGFATEGGKVPDERGRGSDESGLGGFGTLTYEFVDQWSLVWFQSYSLDIPWNRAPNDLSIRDPRLGVRYHPVNDLGTIRIDGYLQPSFWESTKGAKRYGQIASRFFAFIPIKQTKFSVLLLSDLSVNLFSEGVKEKDRWVGGFTLGGLSLEITKTISWDSAAQIGYGYQALPYTLVFSRSSNFQTGVVFALTESFDLGGYISVPLRALPRPENMYFSAQINATIL